MGFWIHSRPAFGWTRFPFVIATKGRRSRSGRAYDAAIVSANSCNVGKGDAIILRKPMCLPKTVWNFGRTATAMSHDVQLPCQQHLSTRCVSAASRPLARRSSIPAAGRPTSQWVLFLATTTNSTSARLTMRSATRVLNNLVPPEHQAHDRGIRRRLAAAAVRRLARILAYSLIARCRARRHSLWR